MLDEIAPPPKGVRDLGANVGTFSRIASDRGIPTVSFDMDPGVVERNYLESLARKETNILPSDSQVQRLLASREDIFERYDRQNFERQFGEFFDIQYGESITETDRHLYLMTSSAEAR